MIRYWHESGASWNAPPNRIKSNGGRDDEVRARSLIEPYLYTARPWGFKDPRTIWTVEGWLRLLPSACLIGVFRHPSLVVRSLAARTGDLTVETDEALRLWCAYNSELIRLHQKHRFPLLHYSSKETLLRGIHHAIDRLRATQLASPDHLTTFSKVNC